MDKIPLKERRRKREPKKNRKVMCSRNVERKLCDCHRNIEKSFKGKVVIHIHLEKMQPYEEGKLALVRFIMVTLILYIKKITRKLRNCDQILVRKKGSLLKKPSTKLNTSS